MFPVLFRSGVALRKHGVANCPQPIQIMLDSGTSLVCRHFEVTKNLSRGCCEGTSGKSLVNIGLPSSGIGSSRCPMVTRRHPGIGDVDQRPMKLSIEERDGANVKGSVIKLNRYPVGPVSCEVGHVCSLVQAV